LEIGHDEGAQKGMNGSGEIYVVRPRAVPALVGLIAFLLGSSTLFAPSAGAAEHFPLEPFGSVAQPSFGNAEGLAVDQATGDLLAIDAAAGTVSRYNPDGTPANFSTLGSNVIDGLGLGDETPQGGLSFGSASEVQVAVDNSGGIADGDIYVTQSGAHLIDVFGEDGAYLGQLTESSAGAFGEACGVAVGPSGDVYVGDYSGEVHKFVPSASPPLNGDNTANFTTIEHPCNVAAGIGVLFATEYEGPVYKLSGTTGALERVLSQGSNTTATVDPASGHVYVARGSAVEEYTSSGVSPVANILAASAISGIAVNGASSDLYVSRSGAANLEVSLAGPPVPAIYDERVVSAGFNEVALRAEINPEGSATTYHVEFGTDASYGANTAETAVGSDKTDHTVNVALTGLTPGTVYHWRIVSTNETGTTDGADHTFRTYGVPLPEEGCPNQAFRTGASAHLADCRAYEMVSPLDKNNSDIVVLPAISSDPAGLEQSALEGSKLSYSAYRAFGDAEGAPYTSQYVASRGEGGWQSHSISPPQGLSKVAIGFAGESPYRFFSDDLCNATLVQFSDRVLAPGAVEGYPNIYRRRNCGTEGYEALTTVEPPSAKPEDFRIDVQGVSADGSCAVFRTADQLTPDAHPELGPTVFQLYESCGGQLHLVSALPDGNAAIVSSVGSGSPSFVRRSSVKNAVSDDGKRVYWTSREAGAGALYLRENADQPQSAINGSGECTEPTKACTIPVSAPVSALPARFWAASADGAKALYTIEKGSSGGTLTGDLYEYDSVSRSSSLIAEEVLGLLGAGEDASRVYLVSRQALAGGAQVGAPNLYLFEAGQFSFVAELSELDAVAIEEGNGPNAKGALSPVNVEPIKHSAYVSPDGRHVAFMSTASPSGYDNVDRANGKADAEVYVYDAASGEFHCASCNPSGAPPVGRELEVGLRKTNVEGAAQITRANSQLYTPRVLSDDGSRLFFESFEALLPTDIDGEADVYEWEAPGAGSCTVTAPAFSPPNGGCLSLVSSGRSSRDSSFVDANGDGSDVFFSTIADLVPQDEGLVDIYDARVGGGFPSPATSSPPCIGDACQPPASPPNDTTPASSVFNGPGNQKQKHKHHKRKHKRHAKRNHHRQQKEAQR
jgi:hypothetical protein